MARERRVEQLDLFGGADLNTPASPEPEPLNGAYYERATDKFVTYVKGRRHKEWSARRCTFDKEWQEKTKKERAI